MREDVAVVSVLLLMVYSYSRVLWKMYSTNCNLQVSNNASPLHETIDADDAASNESIARANRIHNGQCQHLLPV